MISKTRQTELISTDREHYQLTDKERNAIEAEIKHYEQPRAACIEALKIVQHKQGWVPDEAIFTIAELLKIPASDVEGVATFYSQIFRQPVGRHVIRLCDSMTCYINGYENIAAHLQQYLGIDFGQTTADKRFTLLPICCLGNCDKGPTMMIDDDLYHRINIEQMAQMLEDYP